VEEKGDPRLWYKKKVDGEERIKRDLVETRTRSRTLLGSSCELRKNNYI